MKQTMYAVGVCLFLFSFGCNNDGKIETLLSSKEKNDLILGALKAGKTKKKKFCNLLIQNADDPRRSTNLRHKGLTVYQAKMEALQKIFGKEPPIKISSMPDSVVIKFYTEMIMKSNL